ncbi:MAG: efflux RND transporter periplasmic adaptor subunit [Psychrobium sp.]
MELHHSTWKVTGISLVTLISCSLIFATAPLPAKDKDEERRLYVNTITPKTIDFKPTYTSYGRIGTREKLTLRAQVSGEVVALHPNFELGATINNGEMVTKIEDRPLRNRLVSAQNQYTIAQTKVALEKAQQQVASKELALVTEQAYNDAVTDKAIRLRQPQMAAAQSELTIAKNAVELAQLDIEKATFISPRTYQVIERSVHLGDYVSQGQALATLADLSTLRIKALVPKNIAKELVINQDVIISNNDTSRSMGYISHIVPKLDSKTQLQQIIIALTSDNNFVLDEFVQVDLSLSPQKNIIKLPLTAINNDAVWIVDTQNTLQPKKLDIVWNDKNWVYAVNNLNPGEQVVEHKIAGAQAGTKVTIITKPTKVARH